MAKTHLNISVVDGTPLVSHDASEGAATLYRVFRLKCFFLTNTFLSQFWSNFNKMGCKWKRRLGNLCYKQKVLENIYFWSSYSLSKIGYFSDFSDFATEKNHWFSKSPILRPISKLWNDITFVVWNFFNIFFLWA